MRYVSALICIFFQIFVLSDSQKTKLSLVIGIHPEFAREKINEINRFVA